MKKILQDIKDGKFRKTVLIPKKKSEIKLIENKRNWYKIGKIITQGHQVKLCQQSRVTARQIYTYYKINKGNWEELSPNQLLKMKKKKFEDVFKGRIQNERETLWNISLSQISMMQ